jgi:hypothetical protein
VGDAWRSSGLLCMKASRARVSQPHLRQVEHSTDDARGIITEVALRRS